MMKVLAIGGPVLTAIGAVLLAYDALHGPVAWYRVEYFGARAWEFLNESHDRDIKRLRELTVPPYTVAERERLVAEAQANFQAWERKERERLREVTIADRFRAQKLALWGLGLVAVGSLCQAFAAWLA